MIYLVSTNSPGTDADVYKYKRQPRNRDASSSRRNAEASRKQIAKFSLVLYLQDRTYYYATFVYKWLSYENHFQNNWNSSHNNYGMYPNMHLIYFLWEMALLANVAII